MAIMRVLRVDSTADIRGLCLAAYCRPAIWHIGASATVSAITCMSKREVVGASSTAHLPIPTPVSVFHINPGFVDTYS